MISIYDKKQNIFELQVMLRRIHFADGTVDLINPDGLFGTETRDAVVQAQRIAGLSETGRVDLETWSAIVAM